MFCEGVLEVLGRGRRNLEGGKQRAVSSCQRNSSSLGCTSFLGVGLALDFGKAAPPHSRSLNWCSLETTWRQTQGSRSLCIFCSTPDRV